jgi:glycosyltransferase involved in cell wall biosynthesis
MDKSLRILMVIPRFPPIKYGGAEKQLLNLCPLLVKRGLAITVVTGNAGRRDVLKHETRDGFAIRRIIEPAISFSNKRRLNSFGLMLSLFCFLMANRRNFDLIHEHSSLELSVVCAVFAGLFNKPCISKITGGGENFTPLMLRKKPILGLFYFNIFKSVQYVIALNKEIEEQCLRIGFKKDQILSVANGVEYIASKAASPRLLAPKASLSIVMIANLIPVKKIELFIDALEMLKQDGFSFIATVIGEGPLRDTLVEKASLSGLSGYLKFPGCVDNVEEFLAKSDIAVHTSAAEGMSNAILEEMSHGLPVVASDIPANKALIVDNENGLLFENGKLKSLEENLKRLINDQELQQRLGAAARITIEKNHSMERIAEKYAEIYKDLFANKNIFKFDVS